MQNIWFLRTDKDNFDKNLDISENYQFIYSAHGSCGQQDCQEIQEHKNKIFPALLLETKELREFVREIKAILIKKMAFFIMMNKAKLNATYL